MKQLAFITFIIFISLSGEVFSQQSDDKFEQLGTLLPTPNGFRTASGAPGKDYWQQKVDYKIDVKLVDQEQRIYGTQTITYHNLSSDPLTYLWIQLDQNKRELDSDTYKIEKGNTSDGLSMSGIQELHQTFDGGFHIEEVKTLKNDNLPYTINKTMMRIDLPATLKPGEDFSFKLKWWYNINNRATDEGRSGYEYFPKDDNRLYIIAQFYPRLASYNDYQGWQNKQYLGRGEFALSFGDFEVNLTMPSDFIVSSTGELQNPKEVLTTTQMERLENAKLSTDKPVLIVTQDEAFKNEPSRKQDYKTWKFKAQNVRDFAFATSRKFIWDAQAVKFGDRTVMAMSFYPKEGNPLWGEYSTKAVVHTLKSYSKYTFDYPYPVAQSIHADNIGMEYPMICFNHGRPLENGNYSEYIKNSMISVIIHEVGHNYFPMIVNSDERQWAWMDEGINTFLQYLAEQEWQSGYPSWTGKPSQIVSYMKGDKKQISPIMTNSESIKQYGYTAYYMPATALNILRETIMGHELFDKAFKTYATRWMFKQPTPADFFRTMEDASAVDLDWFWRAWFYTIDNVEISVDKVSIYCINEKGDTDDDKTIAVNEDKNYKIINLSKKRFDNHYAQSLSHIKDFDITKYYYVKMSFSNNGGIVMPIIVQFDYDDGTSEIKRIPAEIWLKTPDKVSKIFVCEKKVINIQLDPLKETADVDRNNNYWPNR